MITGKVKKSVPSNVNHLVTVCVLLLGLSVAGCSDEDGGLAKVQQNATEQGKAPSELHTLEDGSTYQGQLQNGDKNGQGVYIWSNGDRYDGDWKNGLMSGQGTFEDKQGHVYSGQW